MVAIVNIEALTGPTGDPKAQIITSHRFSLSENPSPGTTNPLRVPAVGTADSWWAQHRAKITGEYTQVSDFKLSSSGGIRLAWGLGEGGMVRIGTRTDGDTVGHGCPLGNYQQAGGTVNPPTGFAMDDPANGHGYYNDPLVSDVADFDTFSAASPLLIDPGPLSSGETRYTKIWVLQCRYGADTQPGDRATQTVTLTWSEI